MAPAALTPTSDNLCPVYVISNDDLAFSCKSPNARDTASHTRCFRSCSDMTYTQWSSRSHYSHGGYDTQKITPQSSNINAHDRTALVTRQHPPTLCTQPPRLSIRCLSSRRFGLWSLDSLTACPPC